jgi:integrase
MLPLVTLALATGMRRGELLDLRWGDIDFHGIRPKVSAASRKRRRGSA